jgi:hypothetical protein
MMTDLFKIAITWIPVLALTCVPWILIGPKTFLGMVLTGALSWVWGCVLFMTTIWLLRPKKRQEPIYFGPVEKGPWGQ